MTRDARFTAAMTAVARALPFGLSRVVAPSDVGYAIISLATFFLNLALLALLHGTLRMMLPLAVTLAFGIAAVVNYAANRVLAFRSHGAVGRQFAWFVAVEVSNYLIFVLGVTELLAAMGVYYELARTLAACGEAVYLYCGMRWLVFRDTLGTRSGPAPASSGAGEPFPEAAPAFPSASPAFPEADSDADSDADSGADSGVNSGAVSREAAGHEA